MEIVAAGERVEPGLVSTAMPPLACVSATARATAWVAPEGACRSCKPIKVTVACGAGGLSAGR